MKLLLVLLLLTITLISSAESGFSYEQITTKHGLSNSKVSCIIQDSKGFLWFGTYEGLNKYDGYKFTIYKKESNDSATLADNMITSLLEDSEGDIWIGTKWGGLSRLDRETSKFTTWQYNRGKQNGISNNYITSICQDQEGRIWIGTFNGGINIYERGKKSFVRVRDIKPGPNRLLLQKINVLCPDNEGNIWIGSDNHGLQKIQYTKGSLDAEGFFNAPVVQIKPFFTNSVRSITTSGKNLLWIGSLDGLALFNPKSGTIGKWQNNLNAPESLGCNSIGAVCEDKAGKIWVGTRFGLDQYLSATNTFRHLINENNNFSVSSILEDRSGVVWIATIGHGIIKWHHNMDGFSNYTYERNNRNSLINNQVMAIFKDSKGIFWIGTYSGLSCFDKNFNKKFDWPEGIDPVKVNDFIIKAINEDNKGNILAAIDGKGLYKWNGSARTFDQMPITDNQGKPVKYIRAIYKDKSKKLWVGCEKGLLEYDNSSRTWKQREQPNFTVGFIYSITADKKGNIWAGTDNGLLKFDTARKTFIKYIHLDDTNSISHNQVRVVFTDSKGLIWIGTRGGLNCLDPVTGKFYVTGESEGILSKTVFGIAEDKNHKLWISTPNGLYSSNSQKKQFKRHNSLHFESGAYLENNNGEFLFGGQEGFIVVRPEMVRNNQYIPPIVFTEFRIFNKQMPIAENNSKIILSPKDYSFSLEFAALDFTEPEKNQYAYKLEGFDDNWINLGYKHEVSFTNLSPGNYVLKVKGSNNDGTWNEPGASLTIVVLPPWWKTWWFRLLTVLALLSLSVGFYYYRTRILRLQKHQLELMVQERTHNIEEQKVQITEQRDQLIALNNKLNKVNEQRLQFFTNVSHEFRTPLSLIHGPVDKILSLGNTNQEVHNLLLLVKRNSIRLNNLVNELMEFRSIESQKASLRISKNNVVKFTADIANTFNDLARQRNIQFTFEAKSASIDTWFDHAKLEKIIYNLISNAFKYTKNEGFIAINVGTDNASKSNDNEPFQKTEGNLIAHCNYFEIRVKDNGIGISQDHLPYIFNEFYRVPSSESIAIGTGIGLALTKELVLLHNGVIEVKSVKNAGSEFIVRIPLDKHHLGKFSIEQNTDFNVDYSKSQVTDFIEKIQTPQTGLEADIINLNQPLPEHILIVEDNAELRSFITSQFNQTYHVTEASNGAEGLNLARELTPDLIISDVMMPEMSGFELCSQLKEDINTSHIPVVLLTALSDIESQLQGLDTGADDYIPKPFDISVLQAKARNLIQTRIKLRQLFAKPYEVSAKEITSTPKDEKFLLKAIGLVNENMANPDFGPKELVDKMCVSKSLLHKKLVSLTSQSAVDFINTIRLKEAIKLMDNPELNVSDIASMIGFNDSKYFSTCFKKFYGKSPNKYRQEKNILQ